MFEHEKLLHSDYHYALMMRYELYELIDIKTGLRVHLVWPQMCGTKPIGRETLDDGSIAINVNTVLEFETTYVEIFWIYTLTSRVHKWIVDLSGVRLRGEWLSDQDAAKFVAEKWKTAPEWLFRQLLNIKAKGSLVATLPEVEAVDALAVATSFELAVFVVSNKSKFSRELQVCASAALRQTFTSCIGAMGFHNERRLLRILEPVEQLLRSDPETPKPILAQATLVAMRIQQSLQKIEIILSTQHISDHAKFYFKSDKDASAIFDLGLSTTLRFRIPLNLKKPLIYETFSETRNPSPRLYEGMAYLYYLRGCLNHNKITHMLDSNNIDDADFVGTFQVGDASKDNEFSFAYQGQMFHQKTNLIPDIYFFLSRGYSKFRQQLDATPVSWVDRQSKAIWRGSTTGSLGPHNKTSMAFLDTLPRYQLCKIGSVISDLADFGITGVAAPASLNEEVSVKARLQHEGLWRLPTSQIAMRTWKFQIDIDGHSNAWGFFQKLLMASCILKVGSTKGFVQWYYSELKEWQHFIPVRSDMSDIYEKLDWCLNHDDEARKIGQRGRDFALARTFDNEMEAAAEAIFSGSQFEANGR